MKIKLCEVQGGVLVWRDYRFMRRLFMLGWMCTPDATYQSVSDLVHVMVDRRPLASEREAVKRFEKELREYLP